MDKNKLKGFLAVARKEQPADLVVTNCQVIDVFQKKIIKGNVAIFEDLIVGVGDYQGRVVIDGGTAISLLA